MLKALLDGVNAKTLVVITLGLAGWHYADVGEAKDLRGEQKAIRQQLADQAVRIDINREISGRKLDRDTYDRDVRNLTESLNRIQVSIDQIHATLERR